MLGNLISAGASLLGGLLGKKQADKNIQLQKQFAQQGIQWKVADAKAAGIHPIYALGAPTHSFSPVSIGDSLGSGIRAAGQDIGRAINSTSSPGQRRDAFTLAAQSLQLERGGLENELLRSQIARTRQQMNPALPTATQQYGVPGQEATALSDTSIKEKAERKNWDPTNPSQEVFAIPDVGYARTPGGGYMPVPSDEVKQRIEDNEPHEWMHYFRNNLFPTFKPPFPAPDGKAWVFDPLRGYHLYNLRTKKYEHLDY